MNPSIPEILDRIRSFCWRGRSLYVVVLLAGALCLLYGVLIAIRRETPEQALVLVERAWTGGTGSFTPEFLGICSNVANRHGTKILSPIMEKSRGWTGEEGILYMPIIVHLPKEEVIGILSQFDVSQNEQQRVWAHEFRAVWNSAEIEKIVRGESAIRQTTNAVP